MKRLFYFTSLIFLPSTLEAYIGPGMGSGVIVVVLGIFSAIFLVSVAIVWYPLKRLFKMLFKQDKEEDVENDSVTKEQP